MGNKKYYLILFLALVVTIFVLGLSYCKENDTNISYNSNEKRIADARIVYSNRDIIDSLNNKTDLSIVNTSNETQTYLITFANLKENNSPVYINSIETNPEEPYRVTLNALGKDNDHITLNIEGSTKDAYKINVSKEIIVEQPVEEPKEEEETIVIPKKETILPENNIDEAKEETIIEQPIVEPEPIIEEQVENPPVVEQIETQQPQEEVENES